MRKKLIIFLLIILVFMSGILIVSGLQNGSFGIESYISLQQKTVDLNKRIEELNNKNTSEYELKKEELLSATENYKNKKKQYEELITTVQAVGDNISNTFDLYDIDFLWTIIGNYATEEGVVLKFDVSNVSSDIALLNTDYILCDLYFTVSGEYLSIVDFIYDLEDDSRLNFEISEFKLNKVEEILQATFVVKSAPINRKNLSKIKDSDIIDMSKENMKNSKINTGISNVINTENTIVDNQTIVE